VVDTFQRKTLPDATTGIRTVYFDARFNRPFDSFGTWQGATATPGSRGASDDRIGAWATFQSVDAPVEVTVCLSWIDLEQARANSDKQLEGRNFDAVRAAASETWNKLLNRIQVKGGTPAQQRIFYTALYHAFFQPADYTEYGRFWSGEDGKGTVLAAPDWEYYSDDWCMWDTFRTTHPLQLLLEPERRSDIVNSLVTGFQRGGWFPKCTWQATGYSRLLTANPFVPIVADAYLKGFDEYDVNAAWQGLWKASTSDQPESLLTGLCGYFNQGTPPDFLDIGYVAHECDVDQSVTLTLEHSFDAWSLSRMADALGHTDERDRLRTLAGNYRNTFNPAHGFMQGRLRSGAWVEPFDPTQGGNNNDFTEATSWIYTWFVPHDVKGLMGLIGGAQPFVDKLDAYFDGGHHDPSNEPGFHVPYLYLYAGAAPKTQERVRDVLGSAFNDTPAGLPGNDDDGAMSALFVWGAIGLYPITPGDDTLLIGSPIFDEATVFLEPNFYDGGKFVVKTVNNGPDAPYVQSATLNGQPLARPFITHGDVIRGGTLILTMGPTPSTWGTEPANAPPSMRP
jgi:predicted alpha-1,2-mannosidase